MSEIVTPLDAAHAAVAADPENDAARLRFYERLADGELYLLLAREAQGETVEPRVFELETGPMVLVFDLEERLSAFTGGVAPWAALPGRVIAGLLKGQGIGLGVNLGGAPSEMLLPAEAMDWLADALDIAPEETEARPEAFSPPAAPAVLIEGLRAKLALMPGLASAALLAGVTYEGGREGHILAFIGANPAAQPALAAAARETLVFSGIEAGEMDVVFLQPEDPSLPALARVAQQFDLPRPEAPAAREKPQPKAPGSDPDKPPYLR